MNILLLDNYDSFTYNISHYVEAVCSQAIVDIKRNDELSIEQVKNYDRIILSPGPGLPSNAGVLIELIKKYYTTKPILGICLGHQAIAEAFGGSLLNLSKVHHGIKSGLKIIEHDYLFKNIPAKINVGRYHSWVVDKNSLPNELLCTAVDDNDNIMAMRHKHYNIHSVQFHPESILTDYGKVMIENWINL
ncbi:MAG: aminodeoxychorismate/anthranilate synthase component II [Bacteroidia bacterium]|nr:aminodeoxychorismate/anthranilate synthase component II [Bacteroidia bacterium]